MKFFMKQMIFLLFGFLLFSPAAFTQTEAELVKKVKEKLNRVNDYKAAGVMKIDVSFINAPQSNVVVLYKKPNKFRVKKDNGISLLPKGGVSVNINSLLGDDQYTIVPGGTATYNGTPVKLVKLLPLKEGSDVVLTTLYIEEKLLVIRRAVVTTKDNGTYEILLDYGKYLAWGLADKVVFSFNTKDYKLPKGITFEYEKGGAKKPAGPKDNKGRVEITYTSYQINKGVNDKEFE